jgi:osmotically-inducible protein OsmY
MADRYPYGPDRSGQDRDRWSESREHGSGNSYRNQERNFNSDREYGDSDYGWGRGRERDRMSAPTDPREFDDRWRSRSSSRDYSGIAYGLSGGHRDDARVTSGGSGLEAGYLGYHRPESGANEDRGRHAGNDRGFDQTMTRHARDRDAEPMRGDWRREYTSEWWRVPGPHAGRGPRGYQRSDERIREEVHDRLTAHGLIDASDIECQVQGGEVTLAGFVSSRREKRAAEDVADDIAGVREVHNHLRLRSNVPGEGVGQTSVLGLTESQVQRSSAIPAEPGQSRSRS